MNLDIETFAKIKDVPIFRAGTHNGLTFSDAEIDDAIADTAECMPFLIESFKRGEYAGNDKLNDEVRKSGLPIPAVINLGHNRFLPETLKEIVASASLSLKRQGEWVVASFDNLKADIAKFIKDRFPFRSVELIRNLFNPMTGKTYPLVFRSVAFLPADIPPAVGGQTPELTLEFAEQQIFAVVSKFEEEQTTMIDEITGAEMDAQKEAERVAMFAELQAQIKDFEARLSKTEQEKAVIEKRLSEAETTNRVKDIEAFCAKLTHEGGASPAFIAKVKPLLMREENGIMQFNATPESLKEFAEWVMQNVDSVKVAIGEMAKGEAQEPAPKDPQEARKFELERVAKERGLDINKDYSQVWKFAAEANPGLFV